MLIDVSNHQGAINWQAASPAIQGAYIKVTEGSGFVDGWWRVNHDAASSNRIPVGAYHFSDLGNPIAEADHFADQYLTAGWQLRPVLDIETNGATANWITAFRNEFRARTGVQAFRVYSSLSLLTGALNPSGWIDPQSDIWVAAYRSVLGWNHPQLVLWQNTSAATVPGVAGSVDADQFQNGWTPAADLSQEEDMQADERDALFRMYEQLAGQGALPGQYPGWASLVDGKGYTPVDMLRLIDLHTCQTNDKLTALVTLVGQQNGVTAQQIADALKTGLEADLLPIVQQAVTAALGSDNAAQAEQIAAKVISDIGQKLAPQTPAA